MEVFTDGSCSPNPGGPGGWAWVVDERTFGFGGEKVSSNQRMEIAAAFEAVKALAEHSDRLTVVTDSMYVINIATRKWGAKANVDLWHPFLAFLKVRPVKFEWVKGHSGVRLNEVADRLALAARTGTDIGRFLQRPEPYVVHESS